MPFGTTFISTNLNINREPIINNCLGGCGQPFSGYKRYVCAICYHDFARYNIDSKLIKLNDGLRCNLNKQQPAINIQMSLNQIAQITRKSRDSQGSFLEHILKQMHNAFIQK